MYKNRHLVYVLYSKYYFLMTHYMDTTEGTQEQVPLPLYTLLLWYYFTEVMISLLFSSDLSFEGSKEH